MHSVKTIMLLLAVLAASMSTSTTSGTDIPTRHLRVQHNGEDHSQSASATITANEASQAAVRPTFTSTPTTGGASTVPTAVSATPGAAFNNIQVTPGSIGTSVVVTAGSVPSLATGSSPVSVLASAPVSTVATATGAAPAAAATTPSSVGLTFGSLNPITMAATLAHEVHGMILGHTNTLPSSYMQSHPGASGHH